MRKEIVWSDLSKTIPISLVERIYEEWELPQDKVLLGEVLPQLISCLPILYFDQYRQYITETEWDARKYTVHLPFHVTARQYPPHDRRKRFVMSAIYARIIPDEGKVNFVEVCSDIHVDVKSENLTIDALFKVGLMVKKKIKEASVPFDYALDSLTFVSASHGVKASIDVGSDVQDRRKQRDLQSMEIAAEFRRHGRHTVKKIGLNRMFSYDEGVGIVGPAFMKSISWTARPGDWLCITEQTCELPGCYFVSVSRPDGRGGLYDVNIDEINMPDPFAEPLNKPDWDYSKQSSG